MSVFRGNFQFPPNLPTQSRLPTVQRLDDLADVDITTPVAGEALFFNPAGTNWIDNSVTGAGAIAAGQNIDPVQLGLGIVQTLDPFEVDVINELTPAAGVSITHDIKALNGVIEAGLVASVKGDLVLNNDGAAAEPNILLRGTGGNANIRGSANIAAVSVTPAAEFLDAATPGAAPAATGFLYKKIADDGLWWKADGGAEVDLSQAGTGVDTVAAIDTSPNANGLFISGNNISTQLASATNIGMVSTGVQQLAGDKEFLGMVTIQDVEIKNNSIVVSEGSKDFSNSVMINGVLRDSALITRTEATLRNAIHLGFGPSAFADMNMGFANGDQLLPTIVSSGDRVGTIQFDGYDGAQFLTCASIQGIVQPTPALGVMPGQLRFFTINSSGASAPNFAIESDRSITVLNGPLNVGADATTSGDSGIINVLSRTASGITPLVSIEDLAKTTSVDLTTNTASDLLINGAEAIVLGNQLDAVNPNVFKDKTTDTLNFRSLKAGTGISLVENANDVEITNSTSHAAVTLAAVGSSANANGASITAGQVLNLEPADGSNPGVVTAAAQSFGGDKTFGNKILVTEIENNGSNITLRATGAGNDVYVESLLDQVNILAQSNATASAIFMECITGGCLISTGSQVNCTPVLQEAGSRVVVNGSSLGGTEAIFSTKTTNTLNFKGLTAGTGIALSSDANAVTISKSTASKEMIIDVEPYLWNGNATFAINSSFQTEMQFVDAATNFVAFEKHLPFDYTAGNDLTLILYWYGTPTTGSVVWNLDYRSQKLAVAVSTTVAATVSATTSVDTVTSLGLVSSSFTITGATLSASPGDFMTLAIRRLGADAGDTLASSARVIGAKITYT